MRFTNKISNYERGEVIMNYIQVSLLNEMFDDKDSRMAAYYGGLDSTLGTAHHYIEKYERGDKFGLTPVEFESVVKRFLVQMCK